MEEIKKLEGEKAEYKRVAKELSRMLIRMMEAMNRVLEKTGLIKEGDEEYREVAKKVKKALAKFNSMIAE